MKSILINYKKKTLTSMTTFTHRTMRDFYPLVYKNSQLMNHILSDSSLAHYSPNSPLDLQCLNLFLLKKITNKHSLVVFCPATTESRFHERCLTFKIKCSHKIIKHKLTEIYRLQTTKIRPKDLVQPSKTLKQLSLY